jgi:hypothetical protein
MSIYMGCTLIPQSIITIEAKVAKASANLFLSFPE